MTITTTFGRVVNTGSGGSLLQGSKGIIESQSYFGNRYATHQYLSVASGNHRVGAFFCKSTRLNEDPSYIPIIILANEAYFKPEKQTQTVSFGETVTIRMNLVDDRIKNELELLYANAISRNSGSEFVCFQQSSNVTDLVLWRLNENIIESWSGMLSITIQYVTKADAGIYECYIKNRRNEGKHAIMRLIVRGCSVSRWGPDCENLCPTCYNGGVCDDVTGLCVCRPGFNTTDCSFGCGNNRWGKHCSSFCSTGRANPGCSGTFGCVPDPLGCSCMAGYKGLDCKEGCEARQYGSTCSEECHCAIGVQCNPSTGCPDGPCADGYSGKNCQVPDACPERWYGDLCKYHCHCEDDGPCEKSTGSCGERKCRHLWVGSDCQLDGRTNVNLIIPESNQGALVTITCIVQANPIPNEEDIHVLNNDDVSLVSGVFTVTEDTYTRTVVYSDVSVANGDVFKCQVSSSVSGDAHAEKSVAIYEPGDLVLHSVIPSPTSLTVNWIVPNNSEHITSFIVNYTLINLDQCNTSVAVAGSQNFLADSTQGILTNLWSNSLYRLNVYAVFGSETTQPAVIEANTSTSKPGRPLAISIADIQETELSFTWQLPECGNRNGPITKYRARLRPRTYSITSYIYVKKVAELSVTFSSLSPCTQYTFQVRADVSGDISGTWSERLPVQTASQAPDIVRNVTIRGADTSLVVSWEAPDTRGCQIDFYKLEYQLEDQGLCGENSGSVTETHTTETSIVIDNLEVYSVYSVTVSAVTRQVGGDHNFEGTGTTAYGTTDEGEPLGVPENILVNVSQEATYEAPGEIDINFGSVPCLQKGGVILNYNVRVIGGDGEILGNPITIGATHAIITGVYPCQSVTPQVAACTSAGCGEFATGSTVHGGSVRSKSGDPSIVQI